MKEWFPVPYTKKNPPKKFQLFKWPSKKGSDAAKEQNKMATKTKENE